MDVPDIAIWCITYHMDKNTLPGVFFITGFLHYLVLTGDINKAGAFYLMRVNMPILKGLTLF